jgi:dTDP-4-amino-4,6-dideoxygalactose transaminase
LRACGVQTGDDVILPPLTFVATGSAISAIGARPVFADIRPDTYTIDPSELERRITPRTRAIIAVHLYGLPADMDPIMEFARAHNVPVIEDNAQAIGATYKGRRTGSLGDIACLSFYPTKNLGACGDAGMILTKYAELATRLRTLRNHGQTAQYFSSEPGWNSRLDEIQAAILRVKLRHLANWQSARQAHAAEYGKLLQVIPGIAPPLVPEGYEHVFHLYTVRVEKRDDVQRFLSERGIGSGVYYPVPLHLQTLYEHLGHKTGDFPHSEHAAMEVLSLPVFPELRTDQVQRVAETIAEFVTR